jgi:hypothetical protein
MGARSLGQLFLSRLFLLSVIGATSSSVRQTYAPTRELFEECATAQASMAPAAGLQHDLVTPVLSSPRLAALRAVEIADARRTPHD